MSSLEKDNQYRARWVAGLSNGETVIEDKDVFFREVEGEISPWMKLQKYIENKGLEIKSLGIMSFNGNLSYLPSASPKFGGALPIKYNYYRKIDTILTGNTGTHQASFKYMCVEAVYDKFTLQLWVDENGARNSWTSVVLH